MVIRRRPDFALRIALLVVKALPRHTLSKGLGWIADKPLPAKLQTWQIRLFARLVGANLDEALEPLTAYTTLQEFFVRKLRSDVRPIDAGEGSLVAPCDGFWGQTGKVEDQRLLQIKGSSYALADLLGDRQQAATFESGSYATFYLSPKDYHRLHAPCDLTITRVDYLPGDLWPVNRIGLEGIEGLFVANERVVVSATPLDRPGELRLIAVGATVVGKIRLSFDRLEMKGRPNSRSYPAGEVVCHKGEEWGRFELGSTLVLVGKPGTFELQAEASGEAVRLGTRIGCFPRPTTT